MKHRQHLPQQERLARSRVTKLIHDMPFVAGGLVKMTRTCGKPNCKCARGNKHESWCLAVRYQGKRKMLHVPHELENTVFELVHTYKEIARQMDIISQRCLDRFVKSAKARRNRDS